MFAESAPRSRVAPEDLATLRCPVSGEPLRWDPSGALVSGEHRYPVGEQAGIAFADLRLPGPQGELRELQKSVYEAADNRYYQDADEAAFMRRFVSRRLAGHTRAKDRLFEAAFRRLAVPSAGSVLEIGSNDGRYLNWVSAMHRCTGVGIDLSETAVRRALSACAGRYATRFHLADSTALPFVARSFDAVISLDVFEHLGHEGFARTLRECERVLKPGGRLLAYVVSQKDRFTFHQTLRAMTGDRMGVDNGDGHDYRNFIAPDHFRREAVAAGFALESLQAYHGFWTLFADEVLGGRVPSAMFRVLEWIDRPVTDREYGNGYLACARVR
jgi:SAM-dependent methyltransferase